MAKKAKKRTKAQRSAAAKKSWAQRRALKAVAVAPAGVGNGSKNAEAIKEADGTFVLILTDGTGGMTRFPLSEGLLYKVSLEGINLVAPPPIL